MIFQNEKQILKIIKYAPALFLVLISIITIIFFYYENIKTFNYQKEQIRTNHILKNKALIKERVENSYNYLINLQKSTEDELKKSLKEEMDKVYSIAKVIYEKNKKIKSSEEIKRLIKDTIRVIKFNDGRGYFFIHDKSNFANTMHPIMPQLEGKNSYNVKDAKGTYIIREMHSFLKEKNETFYEWYWYKPKDKKTQYKKIGYIKNFEPFNWFIGTGEYVIDFEKQQKEKALKELNTIKYENDNYIFVIDYKGKILSHLDKSNINKNVLENKDFKYIKDMIELSKKGSAYISYLQNKRPLSNEFKVQKTSYVKGINDWQWMIGSGFYEDDINIIIEQKKAELDKIFYTHIRNTLFISVSLTIILLLLSLILAKTIEKKFKKYKEDINQHLNEKIEQQNILSQQMKLASMGEMLRNIAHQWRQPLSSITACTSSVLLQKQLDTLDDDSLINNLEIINARALYLSKTIDDFRNFFNTDKQSTQFTLKEIIDNAIVLVGSKFTVNNKIDIIKHIEDIEISNLKNELIQVILNILNNSIDALNNKNQKFIFIDIYKKEQKVIIEIKDSAGGIDSEIIDKIFEPYFTTKHQAQGTGIGLYMSQQIITKNMQGDIYVSNQDFTYLKNTYTGALFKIELPLKRRD